MKAALLGFLLPACVASRAAEESQAPEPWSFSATAFAYLVPDDEDYGSGVVTADRGRIHIEGRYNYEDLDTGSVFAGWNLEFGEELTLALTPMVGGVFGETSGVAPAYELTLGYRKLELYSEGEYVFAESSADSFLYTWSELAYSPWDWFRGGLVVQRTRAYETDVDVQRGLLLGFAVGQAELTGYVFNLGWDDPTFVLSLGFDF